MKTLFFPPVKKIIYIFSLIVFSSHFLFSQNSIILKYPGLRITPEDFIPSPAHSVGYMQYSYEDPVRDLFITPGKNFPDFKATGFISYQYFADDNKYNVTAYAPNFENYESIFHKHHFPAGGILNLYGITFGFLYGYGSVPIESYWNYNRNYSTFSDTLKSKGTNQFYNLSLAVNPFSTFTLGVSYSSHNFKRNYNYREEDYNINYFIPDEFIVGLGYTFFDKLKVYMAYGNYKIKNDEKRELTSSPDRSTTTTTDYNGDLINLDLKYAYQNNLNLFLRTAYDSRKINWKQEMKSISQTNRYQDGNARYYKIGVGVNYKIERVGLYTEFNYEPGYYNLQYVTQTVTWDPPVSGNEFNYYDWNFGLGIEVQPFDFMKFQLGNRYFKTNRKLTQEIELTKYATFDPDFTTSTNVITAGMEIRLYNFVLNYVFNHSSYQSSFQRALSPFPAIGFREFNPVQHKFLLRYEF